MWFNRTVPSNTRSLIIWNLESFYFAIGEILPYRAVYIYTALLGTILY